MVEVVSCSATAEGHGVSRYLFVLFGDRTYGLWPLMAGYFASPSQMSYTTKYLALGGPYIFDRLVK